MHRKSAVKNSASQKSAGKIS